MSETKHIKIEILGREFSIKTDGNEQYVREVVNHVNRKAQEVMASGHTATTLDVMIKTAVIIAEELFKTQEENLMLSKRVEEESTRLIQYIDQHLHAE